MKRKLTRASIDELKREMPVLTEFEMECCSGGDGGNVSWDCLFNCMHYMNPSRTSQDYANEYKDLYNFDPVAAGGVFLNYNSDVLTSLGFNNKETNSMINSNDYHQIVILDNNDGTSHAVIATSMPNNNGVFTYYDPTKGEVMKGSISNIATIYRIEKSDINSSGGANTGYEGYTSFGVDAYSSFLGGANASYEEYTSSSGFNNYDSNYNSDNYGYNTGGYEIYGYNNY